MSGLFLFSLFGKEKKGEKAPKQCPGKQKERVLPCQEGERTRGEKEGAVKGEGEPFPLGAGKPFGIDDTKDGNCQTKQGEGEDPKKDPAHKGAEKRAKEGGASPK